MLSMSLSRHRRASSSRHEFRRPRQARQLHALEARAAEIEPRPNTVAIDETLREFRQISFEAVPLVDVVRQAWRWPVPLNSPITCSVTVSPKKIDLDIPGLSGSRRTRQQAACRSGHVALFEGLSAARH